MKLNTFALIAAIIAVVFGVGLLLFPYQVVSLYGTHLDISGQFMSRYFGSALLGLGVIFYTARNAETREALMKKGLLGSFVFGITGLAVAIYDSIAGTHNSLVYLNYVIYGFFAIGFGYYYFKK